MQKNKIDIKVKKAVACGLNGIINFEYKFDSIEALFGILNMILKGKP